MRISQIIENCGNKIVYIKSRLSKKISVLIRKTINFLIILLTNTIRIIFPEYRNLIIRKGTTDYATFADIFIFNRFKLPPQLKPKLIIDAGAYVGYTPFFFACKYPGAKIIAIEPEQSNFNILQKNIKNKPNITAINFGLWNKDCFLKIIDRGTGKWGFMTKEVLPTENYDIKAITINTLLKEQKTNIIDILKIDIEGSEQELFSNNFESWIKNVNVMIIELHDRIKENCSKNLYAAINKNDWQEHKKGEKVILVRKILLT